MNARKASNSSFWAGRCPTVREQSSLKPQLSRVRRILCSKDSQFELSKHRRSVRPQSMCILHWAHKCWQHCWSNVYVNQWFQAQQSKASNMWKLFQECPCFCKWNKTIQGKRCWLEIILHKCTESRGRHTSCRWLEICLEWRRRIASLKFQSLCPYVIWCRLCFGQRRPCNIHWLRWWGF